MTLSSYPNRNAADPKARHDTIMSALRAPLSGATASPCLEGDATSSMVATSGLPPPVVFSAGLVPMSVAAVVAVVCTGLVVVASGRAWRPADERSMRRTNSGLGTRYVVHNFLSYTEVIHGLDNVFIQNTSLHFRFPVTSPGVTVTMDMPCSGGFAGYYYPGLANMNSVEVSPKGVTHDE